MDEVTEGLRGGPPAPGKDKGAVAGGASPSGRKANRESRNPFVEYEDREQKLKRERRWLQEDPEYMETRLRGLQHSTMQARLGKHLDMVVGEALVGDESSAADIVGAMRPHIHAVRQMKAYQPTIAPQTPASRPAERTEPSSTRHLRNLQRELAESADKVRSARRRKEPPPPPKPRYEDNLGLASLFASVR